MEAPGLGAPHHLDRASGSRPDLQGQSFLAFRFAFFRPAKAASLRLGLALNLTVAPAFTATFSPVRGLRAVRFGVSRTTNAPKSGSVKRPVSMISALIAAIRSAASRLAVTAGISVDWTMTSVRNFLDIHTSL